MMKHDGQVKLAIPLGDPAGIGTEVVLKALAKPEIVQNCQMTVIGTRSLLQQTYQQLTGETIADPDTFSLLDIPVDTSQITPGYGNAASGEASFAYLSEAIARTLAGEFQGIVTAPIAKACWKLAGYDYPGQTEVLAQAAGVEKFGMLFVARSPHTGWTLRTLLATTHIPLSQVPTALTPEVMSRKLDLLMACLQQDFAISRPKIAIAGLNPHSGEQGQLGSEERDWLQAWLAKERQTYPQAELIGLIPPDTMWVKPARAWYGQREAGEQGSRGAEEAGEQRRQESGSENREQSPADAYLALYHDQGLIPVKLMAFDQAINTTIGLPFIRTSPDHGTAFDIAGKGIANPHSAIAAIQLAAELVRHRLLC